MRVLSQAKTGVAGLSLAVLAGLIGVSPTAVSPNAESPAARENPITGRIPEPAAFFGFEMGAEGRLATYPKVVEYLTLVAQNSRRVEMELIGKTTMGNDYHLLTISSPRNLARLDRLVEINQRLANPGELSETEARRLAEESVPFYAIEISIHSTESASGQMVVNLLHRLATSRSGDLGRALDEAVVLVIPSQNPDGQHLVNGYFNETADTDYERVYPDLYHKYTGHDDNRDFWLFSQIESRYRAQIMQKYRPVAVNLVHQMGARRARMFVPPYADPVSTDVDPNVLRATSDMGTGIARKLTAGGKTGVTSTGYSILWTPIYLTFLGTTPLLTETASTRDLAYTFESRDGRPLGPQVVGIDNPEPYRGSTWTLKQAVDYQEAAALAGLDWVVTNGAELQYANLYLVARNGIERKGLDSYAFVIPADQRDPYATYEVLKLLEFTQVQIHRATAPFTADGTSYPAGSYVVKLAQPLGRFAHQYLAKVPPTPTGAGTAYKESAGALGMLLGVDIAEVTDPFEASLTRVTEVTLPEVTVPPPPEGGAYLVSPTSYGAFLINSELQARSIPTFRAAESFEAAGDSYPPGTFVVPATEQTRRILQDGADATGIEIGAAAQAPSVAGFALKPGTRVGLYRGINNMPGGWVWWLFDQYRLDYRIVGAQDFAGDLNDMYDTIVLPSGVTRRRIVEGLDTDRYPERFSWAGGVGQAGWEKLRDFVEDGGTLLAIDDAVGDVRELLDLPIQPAVPSDRDEFNIPGAMLNHTFDPTHPVAWGMPDQWPVWFTNNQAFTVTDPSSAQVASSYPAEDELIVSGDGLGQQHLAGKANIVSYRIGDGYVVTYGNEITFRSWPRGELNLLFNAIYHGPSTEVSADQFAVPDAGSG